MMGETERVLAVSESRCGAATVRVLAVSESRCWPRLNVCWRCRSRGCRDAGRQIFERKHCRSLRRLGTPVVVCDDPCTDRRHEKASFNHRSDVWLKPGFFVFVRTSVAYLNPCRDRQTGNQKKKKTRVARRNTERREYGIQRCSGI